MPSLPSTGSDGPQRSSSRERSRCRIPALAQPRVELEAPELEPRARVLRLQLDRPDVELERLPVVPPRLLRHGLREDRLDRERVQRAGTVGAVDRIVRIPPLERRVGVRHRPARQPGRRQRGEDGDAEHDGARREERLPHGLDRRPPGRNEHAEHEEQRRGDADEVPVVVDHRMREIGQRHNCERQARGRLRLVQPPQRADDPEGRRHAGAGGEQEADQTRLGEKLEREVVRLRRHRGVRAERPPRQRERPGPGSRDRVVLPELPRLPHQVQRLFDPKSLSRSGPVPAEVTGFVNSR